MKTIFNKTHFLLSVLLISAIASFAGSHLANEINQAYVDVILAFNALVIAFVTYLLIKEANKTELLHNSLQEQHTYLQKLTDKIPSAVYQFEITADGKMSFPFMSKAIEKMLSDLTLKQILADASIPFSRIHPDEIESFLANIEHSRQTLTDWEAEFRVITNNGEIKWLQGSSRPEKKENGTVVWYGYMQDITERKLSENLIHEMNENLEKRVKERTEDLEFFAYSVSHDLRSPLRAINGFAKILKEDYKEVLDESGKELLATIAGNAQKMDKLIEDLLKLSRVGKAELVKSLTDMNALVSGVIDDFKFAHQNYSTEIVMNNLPNANCDTGLMKQVWTNLLSNAAKYSAKNPNAKIELGFTQKEGADVYYIKDNGIGFDMKHANKLFGVFQRLHSAEEFEGTGVGLVIVQRVIKKHGGQIFAEAEAGKGASFYFALPEKN